MLKKLLVVDDEQGMREGLQDWLGECGYYVETAGTGDDALERMKENLPHLILLDVSMPDKDGFQVLEHLKSNPRTSSIPVIMLSARCETDFIIRAKNMRATDYVTKPFEENDLLEIIRRYENDSFFSRRPPF